MLDVLLVLVGAGFVYLIAQNTAEDVVSNSTDISNLVSSADSSVSGSAPAASGGTGGGNTSALQKWAEAIFHFEGGKPGDLNVRNNNPGNLKYNGQSGAVGADDRGFAVFSSMSAGYDALIADLSAKVDKYSNYSILQIMTRYLGGNVNHPQVTSEGNPFAYADAVAKKLGVSTSDKLGDIFG